MARVAPIRSSRRVVPLAALVTVIAGLAGASGARADFIAAYDTTSSSGGQDIAVVDASTGVPIKLPTGINTAAAELHPSLSPDGRYLAFERIVPHIGLEQPLVLEKRTMVYNLRTGADVTPANLTVPVGDPGNATPAFSEDGTQLATARYPDGARTDGTLRITQAASLPSSSGQVTISSEAPPPLQIGCGFAILCGIGVPKTFDPSVGTGSDPLLAWTEDYVPLANNTIGTDPFETGIVMRRFGPGFVGEGSAFTVTAGPGAVSHPSVGALNLVAYQVGGDISLFDFGARQNYATVPGVDTPLPERVPTWTPDGRYLAFLRQGTDNHERLELFDFGQTQQPVNGGGLDLGAIPDPGKFGNLSVVETSPPPTVFCAAGCTKLAVGLPRTIGGTLVGLLVERITGTHKLFGHTRPTVVKVGRIPLGFHRKGFDVPTPLRIAGHKLRDGRYLITARTLTADGLIKDLSLSLTVRVRHGRLSA